MLRLPTGVTVARVDYDWDRDVIAVVLHGEEFPSVPEGDVIPFVQPLCTVEEPFGVRVEWPHYPVPA